MSKVIVNSIGMRLVLLPSGEFLMGSPDSDEMAYDWERPQHRVRITKPFYLGICPVTQAEYQRLMGYNPSRVKGDPNRPVEQVSWNEVQEFLHRLSALPDESATGGVYRLPTEAQWEYSCRAGSTTRWCFGDDEGRLGEYAWFDGNSGDDTHPVGQKQPNAWGLYDMHGHVWEWCEDCFDDYDEATADDPTGPSRGSLRVIRGGSWFIGARHCRSAKRGIAEPENTPYVGFRVSRVPADE